MAVCCRRYIVFLLWAVITHAAAAPSIRPEPLETVIKKMEQAAERQRADLCAYSVDRRYTIRNKHLTPDTVMKVHLTYRLGSGKQFQNPSLSGAHGLMRYSLSNLLKEEEKTSHEQEQSAQYNSANYDFALLGVEQLRGQACYRVKLKPKRKSKYLIDGEAWIDAKQYAIIQVKGQLSENPSFWVHQPQINQQFEDYHGFWLPSYNHSAADITFWGETSLTIEYSNYKTESCQRSFK